MPTTAVVHVRMLSHSSALHSVQVLYIPIVMGRTHLLPKGNFQVNMCQVRDVHR
jgi:hypothetical protein